MKFFRFWAVAKKEYLHVIRDWRSLIMSLFIPIFLVVLFGYTLNLDVDRVPLAIWDQSNTPDSRDFISHFAGSTYFAITDKKIDNYRDIEKAIDSRDVVLALVIPANFSTRSRIGTYTHGKNYGATQVQLIADGSDSNTATLALGYAEAIVGLYSGEIITKKIQMKGKEPKASPIDLRSIIWFNPTLESKNNIVPGLLAVIMMVISALLTSLTIAREWERGTMEQLISTPIKVSEFVLGKFFPYFTIGIIDVAMIIFAAEYIFDVPFRGSFWLLAGMSVIFLIGSLSLGLFISIVTKNQLMASQLAMLFTFLPSFLLSGFVTPIANMPKFIQTVSNVIPAKYLVSMLRAIYLKGVGLRVVFFEAFFLSIFSIVMVVTVFTFFKKKLT